MRTWLMWVLIIPLLGLSGATAWSQTGRSPYGATTSAVSPFSSPELNPFLNPYATMRPMDRDTALLYLLKARDATGAVGSGRLSGSRAAPGGSVVDSRRPPAEMPRSGMTPDGGASRYFRRAPESATSRAAYFTRQNHYFGNNGH